MVSVARCGSIRGCKILRTSAEFTHLIFLEVG